MKLEQEVDAFLAVRYVSRRRQQFFQTIVSSSLTCNVMGYEWAAGVCVGRERGEIGKMAKTFGR
jgi:hypothetical protein